MTLISDMLLEDDIQKSTGKENRDEHQIATVD